MTDYKLTEDDRKLLTEKVLDECWKPGLVGFPYNFKGKVYSNRTFTTPQDQKDLMRAIEKKEKWDRFFYYTITVYLQDCPPIEQTREGHNFWLDDQEERFCKLVADFWRTTI